MILWRPYTKIGVWRYPVNGWRVRWSCGYDRARLDAVNSCPTRTDGREDRQWTFFLLSRDTSVIVALSTMCIRAIGSERIYAVAAVVVRKQDAAEPHDLRPPPHHCRLPHRISCRRGKRHTLRSPKTFGRVTWLTRPLRTNYADSITTRLCRTKRRTVFHSLKRNRTKGRREALRDTLTTTLARTASIRTSCKRPDGHSDRIVENQEIQRAKIRPTRIICVSRFPVYARTHSRCRLISITNNTY